MPWQQVTPMSQKKEFINLAQGEDVNISRLCRYFQVSRKTAYKWLGRYRQEGEVGLGLGPLGPPKAYARTKENRDDECSHIKLNRSEGETPTGVAWMGIILRAVARPPAGNDRSGTGRRGRR